MLTASIVIFNSLKSQIDKVIASVANSKVVSTLYIIDNSPSEESKKYFESCSINEIIKYIPHENTGYGSSHNIAIRASIAAGADYHLVLNPDIYFNSDVLPKLINYMDSNEDVGYILPRVEYPDGELQYLCKLLPKPFDVFARRFLPMKSIIKSRNEFYELRMSKYDRIMNPPCLSGCFMFMRVSMLKKNNLFFDERFFMYFEDFDLVRRMHSIAKTIYYPNVTIVHNHAKSSYSNKKMLMIHIKSAIKYFNKWGWLFDKERESFNNKILQEIELANN